MKTWVSLRRQGWLLSPHIENWQKKIVTEMRARLPSPSDGLWLLSSGTSSVGTVKALHLRGESLELSARTVNKFLAVGRSDRWLLALPEYHVGGLGVLVRAHLSGSRVVPFQGKWSAKKFLDVVERERVTIVSLVPTQIFDLVEAGFRSPASLRAVIVGGGALSEELYSRARALGWPLLPSYGLTECCSQVATASLESLREGAFPRMKVLPHVKVEARVDQRIFLQSDSLCRWIAVGSAGGQVTLEDPLREGWMATSDLGDLNSYGLRVLGRTDAVVKILGELVQLREVEESFRQFTGVQEAHIAALRDARSEHSLVVFVTGAMSFPDFEKSLSDFNSQVAGPRRVQKFCWVPEIPRTALGKIRSAELLSLLQTSGLKEMKRLASSL